MNLNTPTTRGTFEFQRRIFTVTTNGKVYNNGCLYIHAVPTTSMAKSPKSIQIILNVADEVFTVPGSYSNEFGIAVCQSLGYCLPDISHAFDGLIEVVKEELAIQASETEIAEEEKVTEAIRHERLISSGYKEIKWWNDELGAFVLEVVEINLNDPDYPKAHSHA